MIRPWVSEEIGSVDLKDKRLNKRLMAVLSQLGGRPTDSISAACGGYAEMAAAYRLFDNDKVRFDKVLQPHIEATRRRIAAHDEVVLPQDTTEIDLTRPQQQVVGAGPLDGGARRGVFLHLQHAFTPDGTALGTVRAEVWAREDRPPDPQGRSAKRKHTYRPIKAKESYRWIEGFRHACAEADRAQNTHFVSVADSEADIYEWMAEAENRPANLDWIVRACQDRALADAAAGRLHEYVLTQAVRFTQTIEVRGRKARINCEDRGRRQPRRSRTAEVEVRAGRVTLRPPWRGDRKLPEVTTHVVLVREIDPPADDVPVEWLLLTSLPIADTAQVRRVVEGYCVRWMIEVAFRVLKSGCRVQERRFEHVDRFLPCLAVYLIVTWRTLYICRLARAFPEISCEKVFEPAEWKAVTHVVCRGSAPAKPPRLMAMVRMVAQLGGYVDRKRPDPPGPQTVWLGLQRTHDMALCWLAFGPETRKGQPDV